MKPFVFLLLIAVLTHLGACQKHPANNKAKPNGKNLIIDSLKQAFKTMPYLQADSAAVVIERIKERYVSAHDDDALMEYYRQATNYFCFVMNDPIHSRLMADSAMILGEEQKDLSYKSNLIYGVYSLYMQDYNKASSCFLISIKTQPAPIDSIAFVEVHACLSEVYAALDDYEQASKYYEPVLNFVQHLDTLHKIITYINAYKYTDGKIYPQRAQQFIYKAKALAHVVQDKSLSAYVSYNLSSYYWNMEMQDSSIFYARQSLDIMKQTQGRFHQREKVLLMLAKNYTVQRKYSDARMILQGIDIGDSTLTIDISDKLDYYKMLHSIYKNEGSNSEAMNALEIWNELKIKADEKNSSKLLLRYERDINKLEMDRRELKAQYKIAAQKQRSIFMIALSFAITLFAIVAFLYWGNKRKMETERIIAAKDYMLIEKEKNHLLQQIEERNRIAREIHDDIGTSLTSVFMAIELIKINPSDPAALEMIKRSSNSLSNQINEIIWNINIKNDNLQSLLHYIVRFAKPFLANANISLTWNEEPLKENIPVDGFKRRSIYLIIKELLNNIVKHARASHVTISIKHEAAILHLTIADNGVGITMAHTGSNHNGNGLGNISESAEKLNGRAKWDFINGTTVSITIPL